MSWAEASIMCWCFLKTSFMDDLLLYYLFFLFKRKRPSVKREIGINNVFRVDFVHCAKWLKQIEKEVGFCW